MMAMIKRVIYFVILVFVTVSIVNFWLSRKSFTFSEDEFVKIAKKYINPKGDMQAVIETIHKDFKSHYPHHILAKENLKPVFFSAGGWTGSITLLHASLTEFVLIYGTAIDTVGHSGRYWVNKTDVILTGELEEWKEGTFTATTVRAGEVFRQYSGEASIMKYKANMWKVSYGRGFILSALPFTVADVVFGNQDYVSLYHILRIHAISLFQDLAYSLTNLHKLL